MTILCRLAIRNANAFLSVPNRIFTLIDIKSCSIGSVVLCKECGVFFRRMVFHKIRADDKTAVAVIGTDAKCFINDLLRKLRTRHKGKLLIWFLRSTVEISKIK